MTSAGLSAQEITRICDSATLSPEEAGEKLTAYAGKHPQHEAWYTIGMPKPANIKLHDLNRYYQALKNEGYVTRWEEDRAAPGEIKLALTRKGKRFIETGKSKYNKYSLYCCDLGAFDVTCVTVNPTGDKATGMFKVSGSELFTSLQWLATRRPVFLDGLVDFRRTADGWEVQNVWIATDITW
jgi:hypothetical protein